VKGLMLVTLSAVLATVAVTSNAETESADTEMLPKLDSAQSEEHVKIPKMLYTLVGIHEEFCEKDYDSSSALKAALKKNPSLAPLAGYFGVYELKLDDISFAISPEKKGCTTDVLPNNPKTGEVYFSLSQLTQVLESAGYSDTGGKESQQEKTVTGEEVTVIWRYFVSPTGDPMELAYPENGKGNYYTTLFSKKWP
jgi:hypothetical protein